MSSNIAIVPPNQQAIDDRLFLYEKHRRVEIDGFSGFSGFWTRTPVKCKTEPRTAWTQMVALTLELGDAGPLNAEGERLSWFFRYAQGEAETSDALAFRMRAAEIQLEQLFRAACERRGIKYAG